MSLTDAFHADDDLHDRSFPLVGVDTESPLRDVDFDVLGHIPGPGHPAESVEIDNEFIDAMGHRSIEFGQGLGTEEAIWLDPVAKLERLDRLAGPIIDLPLKIICGTTGQIALGLKS